MAYRFRRRSAPIIEPATFGLHFSNGRPSFVAIFRVAVARRCQEFDLIESLEAQFLNALAIDADVSSSDALRSKLTKLISLLRFSFYLISILPLSFYIDINYSDVECNYGN